MAPLWLQCVGVATYAILLLSVWLQYLANVRNRLRFEALERRVLEVEPRSHATMTLVVDLGMVSPQPGAVSLSKGPPS